MIFDVTTNEDLDIEIITEFSVMPGFLNSAFPDFEGNISLDAFLRSKYKEENINLQNTVNLLKKNQDKILQLLPLLSDILETEWDGIDGIRAYVGLCPIQPRFLDDHSFILNYQMPENLLLHFAAHEIIHFIYFKKWLEVFPDDSPKTYEHPHENWIISEILDPIVMRDPRIMNIIPGSSGLYDGWTIVNKELNFLEDFQTIYNDRDSFTDFLLKSKERYQELDKQHNLTKILIDKM